MTGSDKLEKLIKENHGIVTTNMTELNSIHREYLRLFVQQGKLERVAHGIYTSPEVLEDKMFIGQLRRNNIVYSHETALYLHQLSDREPLAYCVTVPAGYNTKRLKAAGLIVKIVKKDLFGLGVCTLKTAFGNEIKVYDKERTICDIICDRNNQDPDIVNNALKQYVREKDKNINRIMKYAKLFRIENILRPYLEILL